MRRGSEFRDLTLGFMKQMGLRPCFDMAITTTLTKSKGEMAALRLELYRTARSIADLEYWRRQVRLFRNGKETGVWRQGDLQLNYRLGLMDLIDGQGRRYTSDDWDLLRNGLKAEGDKVVKAKATKVEEPIETSAAPGEACCPALFFFCPPPGGRYLGIGARHRFRPLFFL